MDSKASIFISYAWGGALEKKQWVRQGIIEYLCFKYDVFWDRDDIGFGDAIDVCISKALNKRPVTVFCLCDNDYLESARNIGSGLNRELDLLKKVAGDDGVRIVPIVLESGCAASLPEPLAGRIYLSLEELHRRGLNIGEVVLAVADGATQVQVHEYLKQEVNRADLYEKAELYFKDQSFELRGYALTHEVEIMPGKLLMAPQWMLSSSEWGYMLSDKNDTFCPLKGRWHWDYFTPSRGMRALGTAAMSAFFASCSSPEFQSALQTGGEVLAKRFFAMIYKTESFVLESKELVRILINDREGYAALEKLLYHSGVGGTQSDAVGLSY